MIRFLSRIVSATLGVCVGLAACTSAPPEPMLPYKEFKLRVWVQIEEDGHAQRVALDRGSGNLRVDQAVLLRMAGQCYRPPAEGGARRPIVHVTLRCSVACQAALAHPALPDDSLNEAVLSALRPIPRCD